jgi:glyoxylase-like metal-dependent hydrolase (beta-lactamase superfamily II)
VFIASALLCSVVAGSTERVYPEEARSLASQNAPTTGTVAQQSKSPELELVFVQGNISMLAGAGGNITVQMGRDGVLLVDSGVAAMSDKVVEAIRTLSKGQITYIVNTNDRPDHVGGNEHFARIGRPLAIGRAAQASVFIIAFSTILDRMSDRNVKPAIPDKAWPNDTYSVPQKNLSFNGEAIQIFHQPATTDGDSIVLFRRSDVISTSEADGDSGRPRGGGHDDRPRPWTAVRRGGPESLSANGDHRSGSPAGHDQARPDARAGEGCQANARLRPDLWEQYRQLDDGSVYRGSLHESQQHTALVIAGARS